MTFLIVKQLYLFPHETKADRVDACWQWQWLVRVILCHSSPPHASKNDDKQRLRTSPSSPTFPLDGVTKAEINQLWHWVKCVCVCVCGTAASLCWIPFMVAKRWIKTLFLTISLNHSSTKDRKKWADDNVSSKASALVNWWWFVLERGMLVFLCQWETTCCSDGWGKGWGWSARREGRYECKRGPKRNQHFSPPSFSRTDAKGVKMETNGTGGSKSPEFILHVASWLTCRWRSERLEDTAKKNNKTKQKKRIPSGQKGKVFRGDQFGIRL